MLLVFISTANAALIETDLVPGSGDGLLTLDTDTNLEWLDLTETINLSFNEISGGAGGYTTILGFRYATHEEVTALYLTAGVTEFGLVQLPSNIPAAEQLLDLMGCITVCSGTLFGANGLTSTSFAPNTHSNPFFQLDTAVGARFWIEPNGVTDDSSSPFQGNYLVREAVLDGPPLLTVFPDSGGNTGPVTVTVTIRGDVFMDGASVALESVGFPSIEGEAVGVEDQGSSLVTTFDLTGQSEGLWDVVVTNPDGTVFTLPEGFTIEAGIGAQLWAEIIAPPVIRAGQSAQFFVAYGNKGNVDATYPWLAIALPSDIEYSVSAPNAWPPSVSDAAFPSDDTLELTLVQLPPLPPGSSEMMTVKIGPSPGANTIPIMVNITTDATSFFEAERTLAGKVAPALVGVDTTGLDVVDYNCDYQEEVYNPVGNVFPAGTMFMWSTPPDVLKDLKIEFNIPDDELADWLATNDCPSKYFDRALDDGKKCFGWHVAKSIGCGQFVDMLSDGDADGGITVRTLDDNWLNHQGIFQTRPSSLDSEAHRTEVRETALASYKVFGISDDRDHYTGGICESDYTPENGLTTNCLGLFYILNPELADENINVPADIFGMPGYQNPEFLSWLSGKIEKAESK